jgi:hypothetical protein
MYGAMGFSYSNLKYSEPFQTFQKFFLGGRRPVNLQHSTFNIQRSTFNMPPATINRELLHLASRILYLAFMRFGYFLIPVLLLTACGGRTMNPHLARDMVMELPRDTLEKADIEVLTITQVSGSEAIAETKVKTAFRFEKVRGKWVVREIRLGHGQWEKVGNLAQTFQRVKIEETGEMLDRIAEATRKYREVKGALPSFKDYIGLSDQLSPEFLTPLIRLDSWRRPFWAERTIASTVIVRSAGPDGRYYTTDDILRTIQ